MQPCANISKLRSRLSADPHAGRGRLAAAVVIVASNLLVGCASLGSWEAPGVSLSGFQITDIRALETSALLEIRVANSNREPVRIEGADYRFFIDGLSVGRALSNEVIELAPLSTGVQQAELYLSNLALATRLQSLLQTGAFDYEIRGKVFVDSGVRTRKVRVGHAGYFDLERLSEADEGAGLDELVNDGSDV